MIELALFASTFVVVFALGFQQQNVNGGHYLAAFFTSFVIGGAYLFLYKLVPDAGPREMAAYLAGGPFGITAGMWVHARTLGKKRLQDQAAAEKRIADVILARLLTTQYDRRTDIH